MKGMNQRKKELHEKLAKYKDTLLKENAEGKSFRELAEKYGFRESTLGGYMYYWQTGKERRSLYKRGIKPAKAKRKYSRELLNMQKENSKINKRLVKHIQSDSEGEYQKIIHQICCGSV